MFAGVLVGFGEAVVGYFVGSGEGSALGWVEPELEVGPALLPSVYAVSAGEYKVGGDKDGRAPADEVRPIPILPQERTDAPMDCLLHVLVGDGEELLVLVVLVGLEWGEWGGSRCTAHLEAILSK